MRRKRPIDADPAAVYGLVSKPSKLARWWPMVVRVEGIDRGPGNLPRWTKVMEASSGRRLRLDFRCVLAEPDRAFAWEQDLIGTPFESHLKLQRVDVEIRPVDSGSLVQITSRQSIRGAPRLASPLMRPRQTELLEKALDGLQDALEGS